MDLAVVILAAGKGTRMKSDLPKVLHPLAGQPLLWHAMRSGASLGPQKTVVVAGHGFEKVATSAQGFDPKCTVVRQEKQLGTGHAVDMARDVLADFDGNMVVLYGDTPLIEATTLQALVGQLESSTLSILGFNAADPAKYGRLVTTDDGGLEAIVEFKDATAEQREISLCNSGVMAGPAALMFELLQTLGTDNAAGEFYLTDLVAAARERDLTCSVVTCAESETLGVNSRLDLAAAENALQTKLRTAAMTNGATLVDPDSVFLCVDTILASDTLVEPNVFFGPGVSVAKGVTIKGFSHIEGTVLEEGATVGPYARLRPGTKIGPDAKIGNFVETKNAVLDAGAKVNHLSYIGDASVGPKANIGAGTITCNYDGVNKHRTQIGAESFIGSNTMLVAPIKVGDSAMTASGSVITEDVPDGALAVGRARQTNKPGLAVRLMKRLRELKLKGN